MNKNVEVRKSKIEGKGLFSTRKILKGEVIETGYVDKRKPLILNDKEFKAFKEKCIKNGQEWDSITIRPGVHKAAIADRENNLGNYGNHSCNPNSKLTDKGAVAIRDIERDEEVTSDYSLFSEKSWKMKCNCGSKNCRGLVKGTI